MRFLNRIKQPIYFARYSGKKEIIVTENNTEYRTGDYALSYGEIQTEKVFFSTPSGDAEVAKNGVETNYTRRIVSEKDLGLTEESLVWTCTPTGATEGLTVSLEGEALEVWNGNEKVTKPWTDEILYRVKGVKPSFHHFTYEVEELD